MWIRQAVPLRRRAVETEQARWLEHKVAELAVPRHAVAESLANRRAADAIALEFESYGLRVIHQGRHRNIVALPAEPGPITLVCAHYDTVPRTPGADDNASAVAVMLAAARARPAGVGFVAFNREEDGMLGSTDFVNWLETENPIEIGDVHVLEMVGYTDPRPGAQRAPPFLPKFLMPRDRGDFVAVVGVGAGWSLANKVHRTAKNTLGVPPVVTLQVPGALLGWAPDLGRSDHRPFIQRARPAVMWTDTAEFRTPHYHRITDAADTLDYAFMAEVLELLLATVGARHS
ncbi:MAG: M28 family peptidase [Myxococcota bacterium]